MRKNEILVRYLCQQVTYRALHIDAPTALLLRPLLSFKNWLLYRLDAGIRSNFLTVYPHHALVFSKTTRQHGDSKVVLFDGACSFPFQRTHSKEETAKANRNKSLILDLVRRVHGYAELWPRAIAPTGKDVTGPYQYFFFIDYDREPAHHLLKITDCKEWPDSALRDAAKLINATGEVDIYETRKTPAAKPMINPWEVTFLRDDGCGGKLLCETLRLPIITNQLQLLGYEILASKRLD